MTPAPWRVLFERRTGQIAGVQFAAAGINAHINFDLPFALVATWEAPESAGQGRTASSGTTTTRSRTSSVSSTTTSVASSSFHAGPVRRGCGGGCAQPGQPRAVDKARDLAWWNGRGINGVRRRPSWIKETLVDTLESLTSQAGHLLLDPVA